MQPTFPRRHARDFNPLRECRWTLFTPCPLRSNKTGAALIIMSGDVQLRLPTQDAPIKIPLEVNVPNRTNTNPSRCLSRGIFFFGRIPEVLKDKEGRNPICSSASIQLENRVSLFPADQAILQPLIEEAKARVYGMHLTRHKAIWLPSEAAGPCLTPFGALSKHSSLQCSRWRPTDPKTHPSSQGLIAARPGFASVTARGGHRNCSTQFGYPAASERASAKPGLCGCLTCCLKRRAAQGALTRARVNSVDGVSRRCSRRVDAVGHSTLGVHHTHRCFCNRLCNSLYLKNPTLAPIHQRFNFGVLVWAMSSECGQQTLSFTKDRNLITTDWRKEPHLVSGRTFWIIGGAKCARRVMVCCPTHCQEKRVRLFDKASGPNARQTLAYRRLSIGRVRSRIESLELRGISILRDAEG